MPQKIKKIEKNERVYVKATATLTDGYGEITATGYAREAPAKKGMDEAQVTGACSSYARKNALSGLFLIDDNKDIDSMDHTYQSQIIEENEKENKSTASKSTKSEKQKTEEAVKNAGKIEPAEDSLADKAVVDKMIAEFAKIGVQEPDLLGYFGLKKEAIKQADIAVLRDYFTEKKAEYLKQQEAAPVA